MQYLKTLRWLLALGVCVSTPHVFALGTDADQDVTNSVTMTYQVNSVNQTANASVTFEVDRKYVVGVTTSDTDWVTAVPGQTFASGNFSSIQFTVTNSSNAEVGIRLALVDQGQTDVTGFGDAPTAELIAAGVTVWEDSNDNGTYDAGTDQLFTASNGVLDVLTDPTFNEDEDRDYYVTIDVNAADGPDLFETYTLIAAVTENTGTNVIQTDDSGNSTVGVADPAANANGQATVENVFAEFTVGNPEDLGFDFVTPAQVATADDDFDGQASESSGFRTRVALGIAKVVEVLWDPVTGNRYDNTGAVIAEPKAIPGAVLMYVIGVAADSGLTATSVLLDDDIPDTLVLPGNPNAVAGIELPNTVDIDINGPPDTTFTLDAGIAVDDQQHVVDCATSTLLSEAFDAGPEIDDADLGTCASTQTGYVVYFVTVNDA